MSNEIPAPVLAARATVQEAQYEFVMSYAYRSGSFTEEEEAAGAELWASLTPAQRATEVGLYVMSNCDYFIHPDPTLNPNG